jgi:hypothetical protein
MDFHKHALILAMIEELQRQGSRTGKTHIIKGLMLANAARSPQVPFSFFLYKHGPYSTDIVQNLEQMQSYGAITVEPAFDGYGVILKPSAMAEFVKSQAALSFAEAQGIQRVCRFIRSKNVGQLERLATAVWIRSSLGIQEPEAVAQKLNALKPHIPLTEAYQADRDAVAFLGNK